MPPMTATRTCIPSSSTTCTPSARVKNIPSLRVSVAPPSTDFKRPLMRRYSARIHDVGVLGGRSRIRQSTRLAILVDVVDVPWTGCSKGLSDPLVAAAVAAEGSLGVACNASFPETWRRYDCLP